MRRTAVVVLLTLGLPLLVGAKPGPTAEGLLAAISAANPDPPAPPAPAVVINFLGLSDTQAAQFKALLETLQGTVLALQVQIAGRAAQLQQLLNSPAPDPAAVGQLLLQIHALQQQVHEATDSFRQQFLELLTPEQKQKVQAVQQAAQLLPAIRAFGELYLVDLPPGP